MTLEQQLIAAHKERQARFWNTAETAHKKAVAIREIVDRKIIAKRRQQEARGELRKRQQYRGHKAALLDARAAEVRATGKHLIRWRDRNLHIANSMCDAAKSQPLLRELLKSVSRTSGVKVSDIKGPSRLRKIVHARQEFCYYARALTSRSYSQIADMINRDHTSVIHGVEAHADRHGLPRLTGGKA